MANTAAPDNSSSTAAEEKKDKLVNISDQLISMLLF